MTSTARTLPLTALDPGRLSRMAEQIAAKTLSPVDLVQGYLSRTDAIDAEVQAWRELDRDRALEVARQREEEAGQGLIRGALHGIPIAVKDIIDVMGLPTRCNSRSREGAAPATADAEVVLQLRAQGAVLVGKVHTTEFAFFDPSPARNPWNIEHTPGGSSSGSAAAVGAGMAPLALGTQTMASVSRPAAYCGVAAFKPSSRSLSTFGVAPLAASFDTIGFIGGRVDDAVFGYEAVAPMFMQGAGGATHKSPLRIALIDDPLIGDAHADMKAAYRRMADAISDAGHQVEERSSAVPFDRIGELHWSSLLYEMGHIHADLLDLSEGQIGPRLREAIEEGAAIDVMRYLDERAELDRLRKTFLNANRDVDIFLWPAAPSGAPEGLASTGDPRYIAPWTAIGGPMVTIPAGVSGNGLPLGCIACGHPGMDTEMCQWVRELSVACEVSPFDL